MSKDCLVLSYEGNIMVYDVPQNTRRSKVVEIARVVLQEKFNKPIVQLNNLEYYVNDDIYKLKEKLFGDEITPDDFNYSADWNDYK